VSNATISVQRDRNIDRAVMKFKATAKYAYLQTSVPEIQYGEVLVGRVVEKEFSIENHSLVRSAFSIKRVETDYDPMFSLSSMGGTIQAGSKLVVKATCILILLNHSIATLCLITTQDSPLTLGMYSSDTYEISTPGGNTTRIRLCGFAIGPKLTLSTNSLNFGSVEVGTLVTRIITMYPC
jgi:hypothetical protein